MEQDTYSLKVRVETRDDSLTFEFPLQIDTEEHAIEIRDIVLSPNNKVKAGRALLIAVRVKNRGEKQEEDLKITASIPELGLSDSDYMDELDEEDCTDDDCDDSANSEELYVRIPDNAESGDYIVRVEVEYDDGDESEIEETTIYIEGADDAGSSTGDGSTGSKTIITIGSETQDIKAGGAGVIYPVTISNAGADSKSYTVASDGADWATFTISPSNLVVLDGGESETVYVYVSAKESAAEGEQMFSLTVSSGDKTLKQIPLKANVVKDSTGGGFTLARLKRALEIGLVILVVLLVILGLIIGFNKLKSNSEEETGEEEKTYY